MSENLKDYLRMMRPQQWYKNVLLFAGIVFSHNLLKPGLLLEVSVAFVLFCMLAGGLYVINDIKDREKDKLHPLKKKRPIASGKISVLHAALFAGFLVCAAIVGSFLLGLPFFIATVLLTVLNLSYTLLLKDWVIVDFLAIAFGFVIRAVAGALLISVSISPWLLICTFLLALFLALGKRRHEYGITNKAHRKTLAHLSRELLDGLLSITTSALLSAYSLYTFFTGNLTMMLTIPCVVYGLFRYLLLVHKEGFGGEPELIFKDRPMVINFIVWAAVMILSLYKFNYPFPEWRP